MDRKKFLDNVTLIEKAIEKIRLSVEKKKNETEIKEKPIKGRKSREIRRAILQTSTEKSAFRIDDVLKNIELGACDYSLSTVRSGLTVMMKENKIKRLRQGVYKTALMSTEQ